jgi:hypothetical protein
MKYTIRHYCPPLPFSCLRFAVGLWCLTQIFGSTWCVASPITGTNVFTRPLNAGVAISVQAILSADSDTAQIPIFVGRVDANSAGGGVISRTNDWLYYLPPVSLVVTDSFNYVLTNLLQQTATGAVTVVATHSFAATNFLTISALAPGREQIEFFGNVGSYNLQSSSNLQAWQTVAARLAWPTGYFQFQDTSAPSGQPKSFYRAATGALAPAITNYQANGTANVQVDFNLGMEGGINSPYPATVESLPPLGYLFQADGSVISSVPALVTGANGSLHYFGPPGGTGPNYASFQYKLTRPADGLDSLPATFQLSLAPDVPAVTTPKPNFPEDIGGLIQLTGSDPDLRYPSNHLQFQVLFTPVIGTLYQVNQDGTTDLTNIIKDFAYVTNTNGWVYYQPQSLRYGNPFDSITVLAQNSFNVQSAAYLLPIDVYFVNHPPIAGSIVMTGPVDSEPIQASPNYYDPDQNAATMTFPALPARGHFYIVSDVSPGTLVTPSNNTFPVGSTLIFLSDSRTNGTGCFPDDADVGSPYATASYFVTDVDGATSTTNPITINVLPMEEPFPVGSGPASYTNLVNSQSTIALTATNTSGVPNLVIFYLQTAPTHGQIEMGGRAFDGSFLPTTLPQNPVLTYVPNAGYYSSRDGLDSFAYRTSSSQDESSCDTVITLHVLAPPVFTFNLSTTLVTVDSYGNTLIPGLINNLAITGRDAPTNAILQLTVTGAPAGSAPYGHFTLNSTNGLTSVVTNAPSSIQLQGTLAGLASAIAAGINYYATPSSTAGGITATLNDLGTTGIGTNTSSEPVTMVYYCSDCTIGPSNRGKPSK